jgi:hypothetical protein
LSSLLLLNLNDFSLNWALIKQMCILLLDTKHFCVVSTMEDHKCVWHTYTVSWCADLCVWIMRFLGGTCKD